MTATSTQSIGVRATGSDGEVTQRRFTLPVALGRVEVTRPAFWDVREGSEILLDIRVPDLGAGQVVATGSVPGLPPLTSARWIDNANAKLPITVPGDGVWHEPRTMTISIEAHDLTLTTPSRMTVHVTDDDKPKLSTPRVRRSGHTLTVSFHPPGTGRVAVTAERGKSVVVKRIVSVKGTSTQKVKLTLGRKAWRKLRGVKPLVRVVWHTPEQFDAKAVRAVRGPKLPR
jgi:hypothetical protein